MTSNESWPKRLKTIMLDKRRTVRDFSGEFIEVLYREIPEIIEEMRREQIAARGAITYAFLDEGRELGFVPESISDEAIEIFLESISLGIDSHPENVTKLSNKPELFDEFFDLILHGMVRGDD